MSEHEGPRGLDETPGGHEDSFMSHLIELRDRLIRALLAILIVFVCLFPWAKELYNLLAQPLLASLPQGGQMIATDVVGVFLVPMKVALMVAFLIALPYVLYQVWAFVAPGLYAHEKRLALPLVAASVVLFFVGMAFAFGWTPCAGPALAAILMIAGAQDQAVRGMALLGAPLTHRAHAQGVVFITGHSQPGGTATDWRLLAATARDLRLTLVIYMGMAGSAHIQQELLHGLPGDTPVAVVQHVSLPHQRHAVTTLDQLHTTIARAGLGSPSVIVVGDVVRGVQALPN